MQKPLASLTRKPCSSSSITHGAGNRLRLSTHGSRRNEVALGNPCRPDRWGTPRDEGEVDQDGLPIAEPGALLDQIAHDAPHFQDFPSYERAILIPVYLLMHD